MSHVDRILSIRGLDVAYGGVQAVYGVSLDVARGSIVGLVGESGSGKSTVLRAVSGLLGKSGRISAGTIEFEGRDLTAGGRHAFDSMHGVDASYVFQDPVESLDPLFTVQAQFDECIRAHRKMPKSEMHELEHELLARMGFANPEEVLSLHPFNLSGGMCQRVVLAFGLACDSKLLLADEPTSALDVTSQAQVIELLKSLREEQGLTILIVSHNMGVIANIADEVGVMYRGHLVEFGPTRAVFDNPLHPYTRDLIAAIPKADGTLPQGVRGAEYPDLTLQLHAPQAAQGTQDAQAAQAVQAAQGAQGTQGGSHAA